MSIPYVDVGRTAQKRRTREALIDSARALVERGITPTVEDAAAEASISRTTAYRYFRNQRELLVAAHPEIELPSLLGEGAPEDVAARVRMVVDAYLDITVRTEPALRTALQLSLRAEGEDREELLLRRGRVIGWLQDALEPMRGLVPQAEIDRLVYAIRSAAGIESLIWLCDVAGLSRADAVEVMKWSAQTLIDATVCRWSRT